MMYINMPVGEAHMTACLMVDDLYGKEANEPRRYAVGIYSSKTGKRKRRLEDRLKDSEWKYILKQLAEYNKYGGGWEP